jgi:geranylgeranyl diphosphate synthase type II
MNTFDLQSYLAEKRAEVDALLDARLSQPADDPGRLIEAMRYSLLAPGKRLRPILALAAVEALGAPLGEPERIAAAAIELVHCYSLIHDDLPAMDNDDFRRGRPTCHKAFGESIAVLAGDALLTLAFEWLADAAALASEPGRFTLAVRALAHGAGHVGMVRGQARDVLPTPPDSLAAIERLHVEKTGALFRAALEIGAAAAGASAAQTDALARFGTCYGIAFQHADDRDDSEHVAFAARAAERIHELVGQAIASVQDFGAPAAPLCALAERLDNAGSARR